ncbi:hypothetical protein BY458DRAFT_509225, partial [Sporodiniella umbellata]
MNRKEGTKLPRVSKANFLDRDSGIATTENEDEPSATTTCIFSEDDDLYKRPEPIISYTHGFSAHVADQTINLLKEYAQDPDWKKVLKHKSGTTVCMLQKQSKDEKFALFRGQAIIDGFTPQSVFYVIGMRKLWDEQFEEGRLIENLNNTTSLTYESYKSTATSKAFDMTLLEKIECTTDGKIIFACTSVNTPKVPKLPDKNRYQVKLQGWVLEQIKKHPVATQITYITQENIRGWVPGFTKKSLARKPLIITAIDGYLQRKADRLKAEGYNIMAHSPPAIVSTTPIPNKPTSESSVSFEHLQQSPTLGKAYIPPQPHASKAFVLSNPPPRISSLSTAETKPTLVSKGLSTIEEPSATSLPNRLYPSSPHRNARKRSFENLKKYVETDLSEWSLIREENGAKMYSQTLEHSALPVMRSDFEFPDTWTVEQICSVIQCFGARRSWDESFEHGQVIERYSQKEYLIYIKMKNLFPIQNRDFSILTSIETNINTGAVYIASISVEDNLIPVRSCTRGTYVTYGWALIPTSHSVRVTFIAHLNLSGLTPLPPSIVRKLAFTLPSCLLKIKEYLEHTGCPPYIRRVAGKIVLEEYKDNDYTITYIAKHTPSRRNHSSWCTDLRIHSSAFPEGFQFNIFPKEGVKVVSKQGGLRIFTETVALEGEKISLTITSGKGSQLLDIKENQSAKTNEEVKALKEDESVLAENTTNSTVSNTEDFSFSIQQYSFVILLMLACYYMGKFSTQCQPC